MKESFFQNWFIRLLLNVSVYILYVIFIWYMFCLLKSCFLVPIVCDPGDINMDDNSINNVGCLSSLEGWHKSVKTKVFWYGWERYSDRYSSYQAFNTQLSSDTSLWSIVKNDFRNDLNKIHVAKRTFTWLFKSSNPGGGRGL